MNSQRPRSTAVAAYKLPSPPLGCDGGFLYTVGVQCTRRNGDAYDGATTGTIGEAQQAPDDGADADGSSDMRGGVSI